MAALPAAACFLSHLVSRHAFPLHSMLQEAAVAELLTTYSIIQENPWNKGEM